MENQRNKTQVLQKKQEKTQGGTLQTVNRHITRNIHYFMAAAVAVLVVSGTVFANAEMLWGTVADLIGTWITRLGAVVMFVGGVMFGLGWKNDDAEQKSRGVSTIIAGAIVTAVAALTSTFFA